VYTLLFTSFVVNSGCVEGYVRLTGGNSEIEGRVEVCHNQIWWAVSGSSSYWDYRDATVVCRHLGYPADCKLFQTIEEVQFCMQKLAPHTTNQQTVTLMPTLLFGAAPLSNVSLNTAS